MCILEKNDEANKNVLMVKDVFSGFDRLEPLQPNEITEITVQKDVGPGHFSSKTIPDGAN